MLYATQYSFPHIPQPQPASLAQGLQPDLDFYNIQEIAVFTQNVNPNISGTKKRKKDSQQ